MKRLLILGAMGMHVPLIKRAKELGIYTITCDYLPENPGHKIADEKYFDSTTDIPAVLNLAKRLNIDGIMTYNSDPAAPTAAYVAEKLQLPGNPYRAVKIMSEKDLFRNFLRNHDLNSPKFIMADSEEGLVSESEAIVFPVIVKPVDSSGSKGVTVVSCHSELSEAFHKAKEKSRCGRVIIEEYIEPRGKQLHGDGFIRDGKLDFLYLGDHHFDDRLNNLVPYSTTYPTEHPKKDVDLCFDQIQQFISQVGFRNGGINVELRISRKNGKAYLIDIGARNGGNFTPKVIEYATGFNFLDCAIAVALGKNIPSYPVKKNGCFSYLIPHAQKKGILEKLSFSDAIEKRILERHIYQNPGDTVEGFWGANTALGVLIMKYENRDVMNNIVQEFESLYNVKMEK